MSASRVRSKARREVLAVRAVRLEAREGDEAAARAGEAQVEVGARRVATGRDRWVVVLALPPVGRERRVSARREPGGDRRPIVLVGQPLRRRGARRGDEARWRRLAADGTGEVECVLPEAVRVSLGLGLGLGVKVGLGAGIGLGSGRGVGLGLGLVS